MNQSDLLSSLHLSDFIALDFETTGLLYHQDAIIEIAGIRFQNGKITNRWTTLVNPGIKIPNEIVNLTGIDNSMIKEAPTIDKALPEFINLLRDLPLVGQNVQFDLDFLQFNADKLNLPLNIGPVYDTLSLARMFLFSHHSFSLESLCGYFELSVDSSHRAGADAENTGKIFLELIHEAASHPLSLIQEINQLTEKRKILNQKLFKDIVQNCVSLRKIKGLTTSRIQNDINSPIYVNNGESNIEKWDDPSGWFSENGPIAEKWENFEPRESQVRFSVDSAKAFQDRKVLLAEAGTGLGKSLAYLAAGIFHKIKSKIPLVVSTYTKNLQDQLFYKDIPNLTQVLDADIKTVLYKGRHNYLCRTRLKYVLQHHKSLLSDSECELLLSIIVWKEYTNSGDISDCHGFRIMGLPRVWMLIRSEPGYCTLRKCKEWNGCFLSNIRDSVLNADIIVVNHSLFLAHLISADQLLPEEFNFIIDEGHNLVPAAQDQLIKQVHQQSLDSVMDFMNRKKSIMKTDILNLIKSYPEIDSVIKEIEEYGDETKENYSLFFNSLLESKQKILNQTKYFEEKYVYDNPDTEFFTVLPKPSELLEYLNYYSRKIIKFLEKLKNLKASDTFITELGLICDYLTEMIQIFNRTFNIQSEDIVWSSFQRKRKGILPLLNCAPRNVSSFLKETIFDRNCGGMICSATLKFNNSFNFLREELGLNHPDCEERLITRTYRSPFFYEDQLRLFTFISDLNINSFDYLEEIAHQIEVCAKTINRRMLVLCTSYAQTKELQSLLKRKLNREGYNLYCQIPGSNRNSLIRGFLSHKKSVLIGTSSFWEGVDLPGEKVEILIIIKIPFANPKEPLVISQLDKYKSAGKNAFMAYSVPDAAVRLKQGFGRLIRNLNDSGICILTDPRLNGTRYGSIILNTLPVESIPYLKIEDVILESKKFF